MTNILITGCNGFLGRELTEHFSDKGYKLFLANRSNLDFCSLPSVSNFFIKNKVDVILHCAVKGGSRIREDAEQDFVDNIHMFDNLKRQKDRFKLLINFASGAEFNRALSIENLKENELSTRFPVDYYGMSKRIVAKNVLRNENMVNLRLFGCFGPKENSTRLVKTAITRCLKSQQMVIEEDKKMDYFYVGDLCKVVEVYINNFETKELPTDVNMCYNGPKKTLKDVAELVYAQKNMTGQVIVKSSKMGKSYTGSGSVLHQIVKENNITLDGLQTGIEKTFMELV